MPKTRSSADGGAVPAAGRPPRNVTIRGPETELPDCHGEESR